jgi:hypothetical protein
LAFLTAWQIYWKYRKTAKQLIDYCYDTATGTSSITEELSEQFFKANVSPLTKELYEFAHGFYTDGPSGGEIKELAKYFMHDKKLSPYGITTQILNFLMQPNEVVEQVCRFAEYIWALGQDMSSTKAYALIAKTHFDYAIKTDTQRLLELVFPFYTFTVNNIHYWLEAFDKFPALLSLLRDVFTPIWNLDDYTPQELKYNKSTEYRILSGNLPLDKFLGSAAGNMVLKLNPSFMDTFQLATDPINAIKGKLQPTLQTALNYAGAGLPEEMKYAYGINTPSVSSPAEAMQAITELLPIAGPIINRYFRQGPVYYERTQNPLTSILPDIFGATAALKTYTPKVSSYKSYKKRIPKPKKIYVHNIYPKKIYSSVGYSIDNFYNRLYNKYTGKSRIASMTRPVTGQTLKYRLKDLYYYYKW